MAPTIFGTAVCDEVLLSGTDLRLLLELRFSWVEPALEPIVRCLLLVRTLLSALSTAG